MAEKSKSEKLERVKSFIFEGRAGDEVAISVYQRSDKESKAIIYLRKTAMTGRIQPCGTRRNKLSSLNGAQLSGSIKGL